jgi:hypothetical protein
MAKERLQELKLAKQVVRQQAEFREMLRALNKHSPVVELQKDYLMQTRRALKALQERRRGSEMSLQDDSVIDVALQQKKAMRRMLNPRAADALGRRTNSLDMTALHGHLEGYELEMASLRKPGNRAQTNRAQSMVAPASAAAAKVVTREVDETTSVVKILRNSVSVGEGAIASAGERAVDEGEAGQQEEEGDDDDGDGDGDGEDDFESLKLPFIHRASSSKRMTIKEIRQLSRMGIPGLNPIPGLNLKGLGNIDGGGAGAEADGENDSAGDNPNDDKKPAIKNRMGSQDMTNNDSVTPQAQPPRHVGRNVPPAMDK